MAFSVFMRGSRTLPILHSTASKLLTTQFNTSKLVFTPIIASNFSGFNRQIEDVKKNSQLIQRRTISHSTIWTAEKLLSVALLPIIPICLYAQTQITDQILAVTLVLHMHWGVEAVIVDYIRPSLVGHTVSKIAVIICYIISIFTLGGLLYFNFNDIGLSKAVARLWEIKAE